MILVSQPISLNFEKVASKQLGWHPGWQGVNQDYKVYKDYNDDKHYNERKNYKIILFPKMSK